MNRPAKGEMTPDDWGRVADDELHDMMEDESLEEYGSPKPRTGKMFIVMLKKGFTKDQTEEVRWASVWSRLVSARTLDMARS